MLKILARLDNLKMNAFPGDTITLEYINPTGGRETVLEKKIEESYQFDSVVIFKLENEFGMKRGLGGAFGEKE